MTHAHYLQDPEAIYRRSFEIVRAETDLARFSSDEACIVERIVHSCGMPDIVEDLSMSAGAVEQASRALAAGAPIICDSGMVAAGVSLPDRRADNPVLCFLDHPGVTACAARTGTTRSAAQVRLWRPHLRHAVIAIGNAPTALFRLIEEVHAGAPVPVLVIGFPVGFVGAAESKQMLVESSPPIPHIVLSGRRGGSAMASAAVNALARLPFRQVE